MLSTAAAVVGNFYDLPRELVCLSLAQETIFRRWRKLHDWIAAEREFLAWKAVLESARRAWQGTSDSSKDDALLTGVALAQAQSWLGTRREDLPVVDRNFIDQSTKRESKVRAQARRMRALVYVLLVGIIAGLVGWIYQADLKVIAAARKSRECKAALIGRLYSRPHFCEITSSDGHNSLH